MREAVVRARQRKLPFITDVASLKRLRKSSEWLRWMSTELIKRRGEGHSRKKCLFLLYHIAVDRITA
jgi:hypothetical protein